MGVSGLLQQLKEIQQKKTLAAYKGQTLAVDTYGWLHRGLISCAQDLCCDKPTRGYVTSVMKKVEMLRHFGVEPYMVFDGSSLPTKEATNSERAEKREKAREAARQLMARGDKRAAWKEFMKAASVTPEMAKSVMCELDRCGVKYVVAPYEADPQMVYLEKIGAVDGVLLEDSDLLIFGCSRLITKLNDYGECIEIAAADIPRVTRPNLAALTLQHWRWVAILSGCDYTKGIPGIGLKTAFAHVLRLRCLDRVVAYLRLEKKDVPELFLAEARLADLAFQYQKVFNPCTGKMATLNDYPPDNDLPMDLVELCCGRTLPHDIHVAICTGNAHPASHKRLLSREQCLAAGISSSRSTYAATVAAPAATVAAGSVPRSIETFFAVDHSVKSEKRLHPARQSPGSPKLSPTSKKLKRVAPVKSSSVAKSSKFFSVPPPELPSSSADEVPEESSPVKNIVTAPQQPLYLTDVDDDDIDEFEDEPASKNNSIFQNSMVRPPLVSSRKSLPNDTDDDEDPHPESNDGYDNEIDDSPVKLHTISTSWREKFLLGAEGVLHKDAASKIKVLDSESSLGPTTPDDASLRLNLSLQSQLKSLQREEFYLSESDDEYRGKSLKSDMKGKMTLLRFACSLEP